MGHSHRHEPEALARGPSDRRMLAVLGLSATYMIAEAVGGLLSNSLALLADAGHMLSDVAALGLTLFAGWIARRPASPRRTYGYYRAEILSALFNGALLVAIAILLVVEAVHRFRTPSSVQGGVMLWIACGGLAVNLASLWILNADKSKSLGARGAWLHVLSDALGSVGAIVAGVLVAWRGWNWADPAVSVLISCLIAWSACALVLQSMNVLMEGAPQGIDVDEVRDALMAVPGVCAVHDLHVWSITSGLEALSAHVIPLEEVAHDELLLKLQDTLAHRFGIGHVTIQIEHAACADVKHSV
ncbi:MAG TPA: cation diffusion facilitator family transporter [Planctomycetota bacterium]|nr:cation diffusion facilitator family transporter [Planctomycetota bacterium]